MWRVRSKVDNVEGSARGSNGRHIKLSPVHTHAQVSP